MTDDVKAYVELAVGQITTGAGNSPERSIDLRNRMSDADWEVVVRIFQAMTTLGDLIHGT